jgi:hypothetical protein
VKTDHGNPARSNPRNHHNNEIKDQWSEQSHWVDKKGMPKKVQKTNSLQEPRKRRLMVHVKTGHGDQARSNPWNHHNNAIKDQRPEQSHREDKKGRPKKGQKTNNSHEPRKRRNLVSLMVGSYLTHGHSNVVSMQITRSNNNGSNLVESMVIKNKNRPLIIIRKALAWGTQYPQTHHTNVLDFLMGTWLWGEFGVN